MAAQNQELEAQAEELASQNEEIKAQAEELASQNEEIESQAEEAARQNEELSVTNQRLERREDILQNLLQSSRAPGLGPESIKDLCERALTIVGAPAQAVALLEMKGDLLNVKAQIGFPAESPEQWPVKGSIAEIVFEAGRTAYVSDLLERRDLASPFGEAPAFRSLLATPLRFADQTTGMVVAAAAEAGHWSDEQFRVLEWLAAQFGLLLEALRWQEAVVDRAQELESANQAKDRFLAMLSHELRPAPWKTIRIFRTPSGMTSA
jgi:GAF domain-containing protein